MNALDRAVMLCGGQTQLAQTIKVSQSAVSQWVHGVRPVPAARCRAIESATAGRVTCEELRPDVFAEKAA